MNASCHKALAAYLVGDLAAAEAICQRVLSLEQANSTALHICGLVRSKQSRFAEALTFLDAALAAQPEAPDILANRGLVLQSLKRPEEALASFDRAHARAPSHVLQMRRGSILLTLARYAEASTCFGSILSKDPENILALYNRASAMLGMGCLDKALADCDRLLLLKPDHADTWNNRGNILHRIGLSQEALISFENALAIKPTLAAAHFNRGTVLQALNRNDEALASYDNALAIAPASAEFLTNRGVVLRYMNRFAEAAASFEQAISVDETNRYALGGLADCLLNLCDWSHREEMKEKLELAVLEEKIIIPPLTLLGYCDDAKLQQICARAYMKELSTGLPTSSHMNSSSSRHEKVRVAYLSADFHEHATSFLMAGLFARHDRNRFEIVAISYGVDDGSDLRARLIASFDQFHDVSGKSDEAVASLLRQLQVDIAVDLKGHTKGARPLILKSRPCPIQVNYLGYPGTMGAEFIDYIIADSIVLPPDMEPFFDETVIQLQGCYQANPSAYQTTEVTLSRQDHALPRNGFIFCCFNNSWKISPDLFAIWMRLLQAVPNSVLWLLDDNIDAKENLRAHAATGGVDPSRLVFAPRLQQQAHLLRHRLADLFLDTLPYSAHTTASDALRMGLPVITCLGRTFPGRVAASLLHAVGLQELIASNLDEYEKLAHAFACDKERLCFIRRTLENNRCKASPFDIENFRKDLEEAYMMMWSKLT